MRTFLRLRCGVHRLEECEPARHLRRSLGRDDIGVYFHQTTGNHVIFQWLNRPAGVIRELMTYREDDPQSVEDAVRMVGEIYSDSHTSLLKAAAAAEERASADAEAEIHSDMDEEIAIREWTRKRIRPHYSDHPGWDQPLLGTF